MNPTLDSNVDNPKAEQMTRAEYEALLMVMEVNKHEISAAGIALSKEANEDVRAYAEALVADHGRNLGETRGLIGDAAGGKSHGATLGTTMDTDAMARKHAAERERLSTMSDDGFESAWISSMVKGHEEALDTIENELMPEAGNDLVREHLESTRDTIAIHLETARRLQADR